MKHLVATALLCACVAVPVAVAQDRSPNPASPTTGEGGISTSSAVTPPTTEESSRTVTQEGAAAVSTADSSSPALTAPAVSPVTTTPVRDTAGGAAVTSVTPIDLAAAYQIGAEDVLDISVWKNPELSRTVPVRPDGKVSLPLVNDIQAAGLTPSDLRDQVTAKLSEYVPAPEVSVIVREVHSRKVAVVGAVKTPGRYELKSPMTVLEVLALAQGLTDFASRDRIVVLRQNGDKTTRIPFNYRKIADSAQQDNFLVRPGDIVFVP